MIWLGRAIRSVVPDMPFGRHGRHCGVYQVRVVTPPVSLRASVAQAGVVVGYLVSVFVVMRYVAASSSPYLLHVQLFAVPFVFV